MPDLVVGAVDGGVRVERALELEDDQGQAVDVDHEVGPAVVLALDLQLVDDEEVVVLGVFPVDGVHLFVVDSAVGPLHRQLGSLAEDLLERHVAADRLDALGAGKLLHRLLEVVGRQVAVALLESELESPAEDDLLRRPVELEAVDVLIAEESETLDRRQLELALGAAAGHLEEGLRGIFGLRDADLAGEELGEEEIAERGEGLGF